MQAGRLYSRRPWPRRWPKAFGKLKGQLQQLRTQVEQLQVQVERLQEQLAVRPHPGTLELQPDEYERWIAEHLDELAKYLDCFVAIDPTKGREGVVLHSSDEAQFVDRLKQLRAKDRNTCERLLLTYTSTYFSSSAAKRAGQYESRTRWTKLSNIELNRASLHSELGELERLIAGCSPEEGIARLSLESRRAEVERQLRELEVYELRLLKPPPPSPSTP